MTKKRTRRTVKHPAPRSIRQTFPQVKFVKDAHTAISVNVRKSDCTNATPLDPSECALAKAAKREYRADAAVIGLGTSYIIKGDTAIRYRSGQHVAREIVSFDRHSDFAPGEYHLTPHSPSVRLGTKQGGKKQKEANHSPKRKVHHSAKVRDLTLSAGSRGE